MKQAGWKEFEKPPRLERRYVFPGYEELREFLDRAAEVSERLDLYPDMSFGRDYVNVTIHGYEDGLTETCRLLAEELESLHSEMCGAED